jgi:hypothetical protein
MIMLLHMPVWHRGYTCTLQILCSRADLSTHGTLRSRALMALHDHGVSSETLQGLSLDPLYFIRGGSVVPVSKPRDIPLRSTICFKDVVWCEDPDVYSVHVADNLVLPVDPTRAARSVSDIEFMVIGRMKQYGIRVSAAHPFCVVRNGWTVSMPTRRCFASGIVRISACRCDTSVYHAAAAVIQRCTRRWRVTMHRDIQMHRRASASTSIQRQWRRHHSVRCYASRTIQMAVRQWREECTWVTVQIRTAPAGVQLSPA